MSLAGGAIVGKLMRKFFFFSPFFGINPQIQTCRFYIYTEGLGSNGFGKTTQKKCEGRRVRDRQKGTLDSLLTGGKSITGRPPGECKIGFGEEKKKKTQHGLPCGDP